ncbi:hypothetical protein EJB05_03015 [Eragrostis curvula]|uniref:F-box domain-containing protein n=1 Tax=Eragrostis curvula TaxID=38414 RepID=A0A5J9WTP7_9POAL|nr:hypothetical protein EJB05_03015 [Eragrostis curvula]
MGAQRNLEPSRAYIRGRADGSNSADVPIAGRPSPATPAEGFMSSIISGKRSHLENTNGPVNNKRRLTLRPCTKVDSSKWTGLQRPNFLSLPEDIVSRITADLTVKEAVRMSVVCSKLRRAWTYQPNLDFDSSTMHVNVVSTQHVRGCTGKARRDQSSDRHHRMLGIKRFIDMVNHILSKHSGLTVNRFSVTFELRKEHANDIDGWVSFAIASKAKVVILDFSPYRGPYEDNYSFPYHLFNHQNTSYLQVLRLSSVTLGPNPDISGFANLTTLDLEHVLVMQDLHYLLLKCPALEWLSIRLCSLPHNLHAAEPLHLLKFLCVQDCAVNKIELNAPNLTTFEYRGTSNVLIALHKCLKLKTAGIYFHVEDNLGYVFTGLPNALPNVETLHVRANVMTQIHGFAQAPLKFIYLKHLIMKLTFSSTKRFGKNAILQLAYLLEAAPFLMDLHLDMLCVSFCDGRPQHDVIIDRTHHNLKRVFMTGFVGNGGQVALVKYILRNAVQLERMAIDPKGKIMDQMLGEYEGHRSAMSKLMPADKNGVLVIL